jgi:hypothetical protein
MFGTSTPVAAPERPAWQMIVVAVALALAAAVAVGFALRSKPPPADPGVPQPGGSADLPIATAGDAGLVAPALVGPDAGAAALAADAGAAALAAQDTARRAQLQAALADCAKQPRATLEAMPACTIAACELAEFALARRYWLMLHRKDREIALSACRPAGIDFDRGTEAP